MFVRHSQADSYRLAGGFKVAIATDSRPLFSKTVLSRITKTGAGELNFLAVFLAVLVVLLIILQSWVLLIVNRLGEKGVV